MAPRHWITTLAIVVATAAPALAQRNNDHRRGDDHAQAQQHDNRDQAQQAEHSRREQPQAQRAPQFERTPQAVQRAPQIERAPQVQRAPQFERAPQAVQRAPQFERRAQVQQNERAIPRAVPQYQNRDYRPGYDGRYNDRGYNDRGYRGYNDRGYGDRGRYTEPRRYGYGAPRIIRPTIVQVLPYRPYFYRPSWSIGIYYGADGYYPYGYTPDGYFNPIPGHYYGGLRITGAPREARVLADGYYVGIVDDFDGIFQHMNLEAGPHHIEIQLDGYAPVAFDVNIRPGETITFRADPSFFQPAY